MNWNPIWWTATKASPERASLDALNTLADCLRHGTPVPEPAASLLLDGLLRFMAGSRFELAMGLQASRSGLRTPVQIAAMDRRNAMIRALAELLPGQVGDKAAAIAELLSGTGHARCGILEADMLAEELRALKQAGLELPVSSRQIRRVICSK